MNRTLSYPNEVGLSLLPHRSILLESYTSAKVNFELKKFFFF